MEPALRFPPFGLWSFPHFVRLALLAFAAAVSGAIAPALIFVPILGDRWEAVGQTAEGQPSRKGLDAASF